MWSVEFDPDRALLQLAFSDCVDLPQSQHCAERVQKLLGQVQPGFCLLTDLSQLERMELACEPVIDRMMDELNRHGIGKIVRVVPEPRKDIGFGIMSLFHYSPKVRVLTCKTIEEARGLLP